MNFHWFSSTCVVQWLDSFDVDEWEKCWWWRKRFIGDCRYPEIWIHALLHRKWESICWRGGVVSRLSFSASTPDICFSRDASSSSWAHFLNSTSNTWAHCAQYIGFTCKLLTSASAMYWRRILPSVAVRLLKWWCMAKRDGPEQSCHHSTQTVEKKPSSDTLPVGRIAEKKSSLTHNIPSMAPLASLEKQRELLALVRRQIGLAWASLRWLASFDSVAFIECLECFHSLLRSEGSITPLGAAILGS